MPKVLNNRDPGVNNVANAIYIGRPSKWGNPFRVGEHGTRLEVIRMYEDYLHTSGLITKVHELRGKDLVCWCAPNACHGDVLLRLANK